MRLRAVLQCVRAFTSRRQRVHLSYGNQSSALNIEQELLDRDGTSGGGTSRGGARTQTIIDRIDPQRGLFTSSTPSHLQMSSSSGIHWEVLAPVRVCVCTCPGLGVGQEFLESLLQFVSSLPLQLQLSLQILQLHARTRTHTQ